MRDAVKVILFGCAFFVSVTSSAHALETKQFDLKDDPFLVSYAGVFVEDSVIDETIETVPENETDEQQPAPEGEPMPQEKPAPKKHLVAAGENLSQIAAQYGTTWNRLFSKNDAITNPDIISAGMTLTIPHPDEVVADRVAPTTPPIATQAPQAPTATPAYGSPAPQVSYASAAGNTYAAGYCTWYAKNRRPDLPNMLGNASSWVASAAARGYATGTTPRAGAIGQQGNHVVYIESVNGDGTVSISEMNYGGGLFVVNYRTVPASSFVYIY